MMKLYIVKVYNLKMCMKKNNPSLKYIKGDNYFCGIELL